MTCHRHDYLFTLTIAYSTVLLLDRLAIPINNRTCSTYYADNVADGFWSDDVPESANRGHQSGVMPWIYRLIGFCTASFNGTANDCAPMTGRPPSRQLWIRRVCLQYCLSADLSELLRVWWPSERAIRRLLCISTSYVVWCWLHIYRFHSLSGKLHTT